MKDIESLQETINIIEKSLEDYKMMLQYDPDSFFYQGLVEETEEYIEELTQELKKKKS